MIRERSGLTAPSAKDSSRRVPASTKTAGNDTPLKNDVAFVKEIFGQVTDRAVFRNLAPLGNRQMPPYIEPPSDAEGLLFLSVSKS